jgi:hypothetical protein
MTKFPPICANCKHLRVLCPTAFTTEWACGADLAMSHDVLRGPVMFPARQAREGGQVCGPDGKLFEAKPKRRSVIAWLCSLMDNRRKRDNVT